MVLALLGEEGLEKIEICAILLEQAAEQLLLVHRPHLRLLILIEAASTGDGAGFAGLVLLLPGAFAFAQEADGVDEMGDREFHFGYLGWISLLWLHVAINIELLSYSFIFYKLGQLSSCPRIQPHILSYYPIVISWAVRSFLMELAGGHV